MSASKILHNNARGQGGMMQAAHGSSFNYENEPTGRGGRDRRSSRQRSRKESSSRRKREKRKKRRGEERRERKRERERAGRGRWLREKRHTKTTLSGDTLGPLVVNRWLHPFTAAHCQRTATFPRAPTLLSISLIPSTGPYHPTPRPRFLHSPRTEGRVTCVPGRLRITRLVSRDDVSLLLVSTISRSYPGLLRPLLEEQWETRASAERKRGNFSSRDSEIPKVSRIVRRIGEEISDNEV